MKRLRTAVLIFGPSGRYEWQSMNEIFPSISRAWGCGPGVEFIHFVTATPVELVPRLLNFDRIVIPQFGVLSSGIHELLRILRFEFGSQARVIFHLHGEGTRAGEVFAPLNGLLRKNDGFVAASEADARALRLCYPSANILVAPFPLAEKATGSGRGGVSKQQFWYCGRISEQKNLHSLLVAFWMLRQLHGCEDSTLELFGACDRYGSPNMGMKSRHYDRYLRTFCGKLKLGQSVRWHGFVRYEALMKKVRNTKHIFVSASLHSDENFGVAALKSISLNYPAVLSAWGGHLDLKKHFGPRVRLVDVRISRHGPFLDPGQLAFQMSESLSERTRRRASGDARYSVKTVGAKLHRFSRTLSSNGSLLRPSALAESIQSKRRGPVFSGYDDSKATPFFRAYAGGRKRIAHPAAIESLFIWPWVSVQKNRVVVQDPHRGRFECRLQKNSARSVSARDFRGRSFKLDRKAACWLIDSGWAVS